MSLASDIAMIMGLKGNTPTLSPPELKAVALVLKYFSTPAESGPSICAQVPATSGAMLAALFVDTVEMLESILLLTAMETVLVAQGVSKHFYDTIAASTQLQRKLFFDPSPVAAANEKPLANPLFAKASFRRHVQIIYGEASGYQPWDRFFLNVKYGLVPVTPILPTASASMRPCKGNLGLHEECHLQWMLRRPVFTDIQQTALSALSPGSWRRMYMTQPSFSVWRGITGEKKCVSRD
ncbi:hypothetical protein LTR53_003565 [Teratosphaeriaceae sp. CCFEE 6253]|nr:hypothetical protein LTR53_003565 [Teratosphaeriaceae sp. CCFEE 6253]